MGSQKDTNQDKPQADAPDKPLSKKKGLPGRPTKYKPEYDELVMNWGKEGQSQAEMQLNLDITAETWGQWMLRIPSFAEAATRAREFSRGWWEQQGRKGIHSREFNSNLFSLNVRNRFPKHWSDKKEVGVSAASSFFEGLLEDEQPRIELDEHPQPVIEVESEPSTVENDEEGQELEGDSAL